MNRRAFLKRSVMGTALSTVATTLPTRCLSDEVIPEPIECASSCFTRMFPKLVPSHAVAGPAMEEGLIRLAATMKEDLTIRPDQTHPPPMAGYTYLGQFINHDLSLDLTRLEKVEPKLQNTLNFRTSHLDLDHVYGDGPSVSPFLYHHKSRHGEERFLVGETAASMCEGREFQSTQDDLPRNVEGTALVADARQDENLVIAQLHVAFLKLHNRVLENLQRIEVEQTDLTPFEQARRVVTWHYQWVVRNDFLRQILAPEVFGETFRMEEKESKGRNAFQIPIEYSLAAGRFGHSMVRDEYFINDVHTEASLKGDLFRLTGAGGGACPHLPADWVVAWERFFFVGAGSGSVRRARPIDTRLAQGLHELNHISPRSLASRTLLRGSRAGIPCGQDVAKALGLAALKPEQIAEGPDREILVAFGYDRRTPLWYYILKEAELTARGAHLGILGSKLVAEVIMKAILSDPNSYYSIDRDWKPTLPGPDDPELFGMENLLRFAMGA